MNKPEELTFKKALSQEYEESPEAVKVLSRLHTVKSLPATMALEKQ